MTPRKPRLDDQIFIDFVVRSRSISDEEKLAFIAIHNERRAFLARIGDPFDRSIAIRQELYLAGVLIPWDHPLVSGFLDLSRDVFSAHFRAAFVAVHAIGKTHGPRADHSPIHFPVPGPISHSSVDASNIDQIWKHCVDDAVACAIRLWCAGPLADEEFQRRYVKAARKRLGAKLTEADWLGWVDALNSLPEQTGEWLFFNCLWSTTCAAASQMRGGAHV